MRRATCSERARTCSWRVFTNSDWSVIAEVTTVAGVELGREAGLKSIIDVGVEDSLSRSASVSMLAKERALVVRKD